MQALKMENKIDTSDWTLEEKISQAAQMRQKGMKIQGIADQFEVDKGTVSRWLNRFDDAVQQMEQVAKEKEDAMQQYKKLREHYTELSQQNKKLQADYATLQKSNEQLMQQLEKLQSSNATLESKIATVDKDNATLLQQLQKLQNNQKGDAQQVSVVAQEKKVMAQQLEKLQADYATLQKKLDAAAEDNYKAYAELEATKQEATALSQQLKASHLQVAKNRLKRIRSGKQLRAIFLKENVLISFMVLIALALAIGVTGPVYESAGINFLVALALGFGTDFAGMLFIYRKVKRFEWMFAIAIVLQVGIKLGVPPEYKYIFAEMTILNKPVGLDAFQIARAVITAISLGVAVYGLGKARAANE